MKNMLAKHAQNNLTEQFQQSTSIKDHIAEGDSTVLEAVLPLVCSTAVSFCPENFAYKKFFFKIQHCNDF